MNREREAAKALRDMDREESGERREETTVTHHRPYPVPPDIRQPMVVIIAGSRTITDYERVEHAVRKSGFKIAEVVSGGANGVDALGEQWAKQHDVACTVMSADWERHGKRAGFLRNKAMADYAAHHKLRGGLIAVWDGKSHGTGNMIECARAADLQVTIELVYPPLTAQQLRDAPPDLPLPKPVKKQGFVWNYRKRSKPPKKKG